LNLLPKLIQEHIKTLCTDYKEYLTNNPKISEISKDALDADLTLEEVYNT
jgi:hypothetical protein